MTEAYKKIIATNRKASFEYLIEETFEAGIILKGSEVKSLRKNNASIADSHAGNIGDEMFIHNLYIPPYEQANRFNHEGRAPRKLLLHRKQIKKLTGKIKIKGYTLVVLSMYFNSKNKVKLELALGKGKKLYDKRASIKEKEWNREKAREFKKSGKI